jgi:beta-galactosidase/beta-glucuronidase
MKLKSILITAIIIMIGNTALPQTISLNGEWLFAVDSIGFNKPEETFSLNWRSIYVPSSWQATFDDLRDYQGVGWYKKTIDLEYVTPSRIYLLKFNAVDFLSEVWVNGNMMGKNEGGYTPFDFDITPVIKKGNNEIILRVLDPVYDPPGTEGLEYQRIPHGKQSWYVQTSGIWQNTFIEIKPEFYFKRVHVTPSNNGDILVDCRLNNQPEKPEKMHISINSPAGKEVLIQELIFPQQIEHSFKLSLPEPELWGIDSPNLYTLTIKFIAEERIERFGFRKFEARNGKLYLNDEPYYMIAALDQDFYPESIYTTPSEEYMRDQMIKAKEIGLNMLRCHIKVPDPLYLKVADEVGLLVWYEVPNWINFSDTAARYAEMTIDGMIERDWNHPSLVIVSIINESWGLDMSQQNHRDWLVAEYDRVKKKAPGWLVVDNSACWGNFHVKTDINDYHTYWAIPENRENFDNLVKEMAARPDWLFSKHGDSQERGDEPLILSEFGNWGLPKLTGEDPWWFERDFLDNGLVLPAGYNDRFIKYKYNDIFTDYNDLAETSQRAQFQALKYEIESIRLHPELQGYVITEFTDLQWECNGLLDMWRNKKYSLMNSWIFSRMILLFHDLLNTITVRVSRQR